MFVELGTLWRLGRGSRSMTMISADRPGRADALRNRAKILAAAEQVLSRKGESASMRDISQHAGVGLATIYRQFSTKEDLFQTIAVERVNRLLAYASGKLQQSDEDGFFGFFAYAVKASIGERAMVDALAAMGLDSRGHTAPLYRELEEMTDALLKRAQKAGVVRADVSLAEILVLMISLCVSFDRQEWDVEVRERALAIVFDGLRYG